VCELLSLGNPPKHIACSSPATSKHYVVCCLVSHLSTCSCEGQIANYDNVLHYAQNSTHRMPVRYPFRDVYFSTANEFKVAVCYAAVYCDTVDGEAEAVRLWRSSDVTYVPANHWRVSVWRCCASRCQVRACDESAAAAALTAGLACRSGSPSASADTHNPPQIITP